MDSLYLNIYSFIQIVDILNKNEEFPISNADAINILSDLHVSELEFSNKRNDVISKKEFLRHLRNAMCHNYGSKCFDVNGGILSFDYVWKDTRLKGNLRVSRFNRVMKNLLKKIEEKKQRKYTSFAELDFYKDVVVPSDNYGKIDMELNNYDLDNAKKFFKGIMNLPVYEQNAALSKIVHGKLNTYNGIHLDDRCLRHFLKFVKASRNKKYTINELFLEYYEKLEHCKTMIGRREQALLAISDFTHLLSMLDTSEESSELKDNVAILMMSFGGFDTEKWDSKISNINVFALVNEDALFEYEKRIVKDIVNKRATIIQKIRNSSVHYKLDGSNLRPIKLEYNPVSREYDVVFIVPGYGDTVTNVEEIRIGTKQLSDFTEYLKRYLKSKKHEEEYERNIHKEFLDYVYKRTTPRDNYVSFYSNSENIREATSFDENYVFTSNRDICRFVYDFHLLLNKVKEINEEKYREIINKMFNNDKIMRSNDINRFVVDLNDPKFEKKYKERPWLYEDSFVLCKTTLTEIFREMILIIYGKDYRKSA